jgi:hypothetical protein
VTLPAISVRGILFAAGVALALGSTACHDDDAACSPGNGKMCDIFSSPVQIRQAQPRLHFTDWQVTEGACSPPQCGDTACTSLRFADLPAQTEVTTTTPAVSPPAERCRYQISSAEGETVDVLLVLTGSSSWSMCCNTGPRNFVVYSWTVTIDGVDQGTNTSYVDIPPADAG